MRGISRVRKMLTHSGDGEPVISVYFPVPPGKESRKIRKKIGKNIAKEIYRRAVSRDFDLKRIEDDMLILYDFFDEILMDKRSQLTHAFFLSSSTSIRERFEINTELPPMGIVDTQPFVSPLVMAIDETEPYLFLFLDGSKGRLSLFRDDRLLWLWEEQGDVPKKVKYGGWYGLESSRINRHVEGYQLKLIKDVVARCHGEVKKHRPEGIILLASSNVYSPAAEILEREFPEIFVRCHNVEISHYSGKEAEKAVRDLIPEIRLEREKEETDDVIEGGTTGTPPLLRIDDTLKALSEGKVRKVLLKREGNFSLNMCEKCLLTSVSATGCPICGLPMKRGANVAEAIIRRAFQTGAEIRFVSRWALPESATVAASLRYAA